MSHDQKAIRGIDEPSRYSPQSVSSGIFEMHMIAALLVYLTLVLFFSVPKSVGQSLGHFRSRQLFPSRFSS